jgi:glycine oxidase
MPALASWRLVEHWAGLRPGSPDDLPLIGPSVLDGLFIASGQFRNGILFSPAIAEMMREIVLDRAQPDPAFDPRRFC